MKKFFTTLMSAWLLASCTPSVSNALWEEEIKPEMAAHRAWLATLETLGDYNYEGNAEYFDDNAFAHQLAAAEFLIDYVDNELDSYAEVVYLHEMLSALDATGELEVENPDSAEEQFADAFLSAVLGGAISENYTQIYVLRIAEYLQNEFNQINVELDKPEFERSSEDRNYFKVYCPTYNETYTLTLDKKGEKYTWDLGE